MFSKFAIQFGILQEKILPLPRQNCSWIEEKNYSKISNNQYPPTSYPAVTSLLLPLTPSIIQSRTYFAPLKNVSY